MKGINKKLLKMTSNDVLDFAKSVTFVTFITLIVCILLGVGFIIGLMLLLVL